MALLTPKDIREHTFQTVRFKEGYDVDEVDDFLDQVTETVEALGKQAVAVGQATQSLGPDVAGLNAYGLRWRKGRPRWWAQIPARGP